MTKNAKQLSREIFSFIEKCQKRQGMEFDDAFDLWLDLAPLRDGSVIIDRGSSNDQEKPSPEKKPSPAKDEDLMTVKEACAYLGMSRATLYRQGIPGKCKRGGQVRFHRVLIDEWLKGKAD